LQPFQTVLIAGGTYFIMSIFGSIATFLINRYAPKIFDHVEKKIKEK
jgi:hypothetical protein